MEKNKKQKTLTSILDHVGTLREIYSQLEDEYSVIQFRELVDSISGDINEAIGILNKKEDSDNKVIDHIESAENAIATIRNETPHNLGRIKLDSKTDKNVEENTLEELLVTLHKKVSKSRREI